MAQYLVRRLGTLLISLFVAALLVFLVAMESYATPALLGGSQVRMMVTEIYTQVTSVFNWPLAAALSVALLLISLTIVTIASRIAGNRAVRTV